MSQHEGRSTDIGDQTMFAEISSGMVIVPLLFKLILCTAILAAIRISTRNDTDSAGPWFYAGVGLLVITDLAFFFVPIPSIDLAARCLLPIVPAAAHLWRKRPNLIAIVLTAVAGTLVAVVLSIASSLPVKVAYILPTLSALFALFLLNTHMKRNDEPVLRGSGFLTYAVALLLPPIAAFSMVPTFLAYQAVILPLAYLSLLIAILNYSASIEQRLIAERDHLTDTIDSLYGFVLKASDSARDERELDKLLAYVAQTLCSETSSDGSLVLMIDDFDDVVAARTFFGDFPPLSELPEEIKARTPEYDDWLSQLKIPLGSGLIGETAQSGKAAFIPQAKIDSRVIVDAAHPVDGIISVPFIINDRVIGVGVIARKAGSPTYKDADFDRASLLADFASLVINNAFTFQEVTEKTDIDTATSIAADIQIKLLPKRVIDFPQASFGCFSMAARGVYSDYYDVIPARRDKIYLIMSDVAGKGVQASMVMVMIRAIIHLVTNTDKDAATILTWVNRGITGKIEIDHFATLQVIIFDPTNGVCEYANAGHKAPLIWREATGLVDAIDLKNDPIGVERNTVFSSKRFKLENGDILMLYTDGLIETINQAGRQYGIKSLTNNLHKYHELSSKDIAAKIRADVQKFAGLVRQHDDQTLLVMKTIL